MGLEAVVNYIKAITTFERMTIIYNLQDMFNFKLAIRKKNEKLCS